MRRTLALLLAAATLAQAEPVFNPLAWLAAGIKDGAKAAEGAKEAFHRVVEPLYQESRVARGARLFYIETSLGFAVRVWKDFKLSIETTAPPIKASDGTEPRFSFTKFNYADATTTQPTEPRGAWLAYAPPPGKPSDPRVLQMRVLNTATEAVNGSTSQDGPNTVDFFNSDTLAYLARVNIDTGFPPSLSDPWAIASMPDGKRLVVASKGSDIRFFPNNPVKNHLTVIDAVAGRVEKHITLDDLFIPTGVALSPDGATAYVPVSGEMKVLVVDLASGTVTNQVDLAATGTNGPIVITPEGELLYVLAGLNSSPVRLYQVDIRSATVSTQIPFSVLALPDRLAINANGTKVYVADAYEGGQFGFAVIDTATATVERTVVVPGAKKLGSADDIAVSGDGSVVVYLDGVSGLLSSFDALTFEMIDQVDLGDALYASSIARYH